MLFRLINRDHPHYEKEKLLRWEVHQKPLGLPLEAQEIPSEENIVHMVAIEKKIVVGCLLFHQQTNHSGSLFNFTVSDEYHGPGFARQMVQAMEKELKKRGITELYFNPREENLDFYLKLGFRPFAKITDGANACQTLRKILMD
jgi:ribosomal protein S18 acetylase RimI-like enzyme